MAGSVRLYEKILSTGIPTERVKTAEKDEAVVVVGTRIKEIIERRFVGSLAVREVDAGSCNGCELEIHALNNVYYDIERFGIHFVASPRHARARERDLFDPTLRAGRAHYPPAVIDFVAHRLPSSCAGGNFPHFF